MRAKRWVWIGGAVIGLAVLGVITTALSPESPAPGLPVEAPAEQVRFSSVRTLAPDAYAVVFPPAASQAAVEGEARRKCAGKQWCKILGWTDPAYVATALPMTDREAAAQKFALTINRASGLDEAVWSSSSGPAS